MFYCIYRVVIIWLFQSITYPGSSKPHLSVKCFTTDAAIVAEVQGWLQSFDTKVFILSCTDGTNASISMTASWTISIVALATYAQSFSFIVINTCWTNRCLHLTFWAFFAHVVISKERIKYEEC